VAAAVLPALAAVTAACAPGDAAEAPSPRGALAIVVGAHANAPALRLAGAAASAADMALAQQSSVSLVVADGGAYQAAQWAEPTDDAGAAQDRPLTRQRLDDAIDDARPKTEETDLVTALQLAGRSIASTPGPHTIVVLDSGLSTRGPLDFTAPGMLDADPQHVADMLGDQSQAPDLTGALVVFEGLGETAPPQQPLSAASRAHLASIWTTVAKRAGATNTEVERAAAGPVTSLPSGGAPPVRTVDLRPDVSCSGTTLVLSGGRFGFPPDSSLLKDIPAAVDAIRPLAQQMIDHQLNAILFGDSSTMGTPEGRTTLSGQRAQSVANILIKLGVPVAQLRVEGRGSDFPGYVPDRDAQGALLPAAAALNDRVTVELTGPVTCG
jgi:outer membrane protein OmpA-like peptidoglycan-associated protein